jgi:hypothetical protein
MEQSSSAIDNREAILMARAPRSQGIAPSGGIDAATQGRISDLENSNRHSKALIELLGDTNKFIIVVLFVGFIALLVAVIVVTLNAISSDTSSREALSSQVQQLNYELRSVTISANKN